MSKSDDVKGCFGDGANSSDTIFYTLTNATKIGPVPRGFYGQFVRMRPLGANCWYFFTKLSTATIAASPTATDNGTQGVTQGEYIPNGEVQHVEVPYAKDASETVYIVRIGDAAGTGLYMTKASGRPGITASED